MSDIVSVTGIVISSMPVGEYDNRIVILTKERGKICAFARGARRMHSNLMGLVRPFLMGRFDVYEGREAYTLTGGESREYFAELQTDIEAVYYGFYFLEIADYYSREGIEGTSMLNLLYVSFKALTNIAIDNKLIRRIFELKAMAINGEAPQVFECAGSVRDEHTDVLEFFSVSKGGMVCDKCAPGVFDAFRISADMLYTLQYIVTSSLDKLYTFTLKAPVMEEFDHVMRCLCKVNFDKHFKSLEILETLI